MDNNRNRPSDHLGINRISKNIRKSPLHQPTFSNPKQQPQQSGGSGGGGNQQQQPPQPQVYNINKNDFRSIVQQLTGTPTREPFPAPNPPPPTARPPAHNPPRPPSTRLQRIRPPPLAPLARPPAPHPNPHPPPYPVNPNPNFYPRPMLAQAAPPAAPSPGIPFSPLLPPTPPPGSAFWANTLESPISAFMRSLETAIQSTDGSRQAPQQMPMQLPQQPSLQLPPPGQMQQVPAALIQQGQAQVAGPPASSTDMLFNPHAGAPFPSPRAWGPPLPSPPGLLPSPTSQFILPSPSAFLNLLSPRSPFPLLSPRLPMAPNFAFSPMGGKYLGPQPPHSPGLVFPPSPSGFFPRYEP